MDAFSVILKNIYLFPCTDRIAHIIVTIRSKSSISFRSGNKWCVKDLCWSCWGALKIEQLWA